MGMIEVDMSMRGDKEKGQSLPLGVIVGRQMRKYGNHLVTRIKLNFEAALKMLLEAPEAQKIIESILGIVEIRVPRSINENYAVSGIDEINDCFVKGDMYFGSDIWTPILDVYEKDFLLSNPLRVDRLLMHNP